MDIQINLFFYLAILKKVKKTVDFLWYFWYINKAYSELLAYI